MLTINEIIDIIKNNKINENIISIKDNIRINAIRNHILDENFQMSEKKYFKTNLIDEFEQNIILGVSKKDITTKFLCDVYYTDFKKQIEYANRKPTDSNVVEILIKRFGLIRNELLNYKNTVFAIKDFNILDGTNPSEIQATLITRKDVIDAFKDLPSVAYRNNTDKKQQYNNEELNDVESLLKDFIKKYMKYAGDMSEIEISKMFSANTSISDWNKRIDNFIENLTDDYDFGDITKDNIKKLVNQSYSISVIASNNRYYFLKINDPRDAKLIGCNSKWCWASKGLNKRDNKYWNDYSHMNVVFILVDFENKDNSTFMTVFIEPFSISEDVIENDTRGFYEVYYEKIKNIPIIPIGEIAWNHENHRKSEYRTLEEWIEFYESLTQSQQEDVTQILTKWADGDLYGYSGNDIYDDEF